MAISSIRLHYVERIVALRDITKVDKINPLFQDILAL
jgi:hypothetical protein